MVAGLAHRSQSMQSALHGLEEVEGAAVETDLARDHAAHVEQIVDQSPEVLDLARDDFPGMRRRLVAGVLHSIEDVHGIC